MNAQIEIANYYQKQQKINKSGLKMLSYWASGNILIGSMSYFFIQDTYYQGFAAMNAGWNIVNLGIGLSGIVSKSSKSEPTFASILKENAKLEKIYLFNAGLDFGYMAGGFWLRQYGISNQSQLWMGAGEAVVLQGLFLAIFDGIMYYRHFKHGKNLYKSIEKVEINLKGNGLEFRF